MKSRSDLTFSQTRRWTSRTITAMAAMAAAAATAQAQSDVRYRIVPLPTPEGVNAVQAMSLNNSNQVSGSVSVSSAIRPFIYTDGEITVLDQIEGVYTYGKAVNDKAHVAGWMYEWGAIWPQAFFWDGVENHWLIDPDDSLSYAQGINNRDQVVGFYYPPGGHPNGNAFVVNNGAYYNLGPGQASDISDSGIVVGQINRYNGETGVWTPDGQSGWTLDVLDGRLATAINDSGTMFCGAGPFEAYFDTAVVWSRQNGQWTRTDIGDWDPTTTDSIANGINDLGQVVGKVSPINENGQGWLYQDGQLTILDDVLTPESSGWQVIRALDINNSGVILADASLHPPTILPVLLIPERLTVLAPRGDGVGATNELIALSATPGSRIYFAVGFASGSHGVPGCPGVTVGLAAPRVVGSAVADSNSEARIPVFVPAAAVGRTVYLQAIDPSHCQVSNVLAYTFQ